MKNLRSCVLLGLCIIAYSSCLEKIPGVPDPGPSPDPSTAMLSFGTPGCKPFLGLSYQTDGACTFALITDAEDGQQVSLTTSASDVEATGTVSDGAAVLSPIELPAGPQTLSVKVKNLAGRKTVVTCDTHVDLERPSVTWVFPPCKPILGPTDRLDGSFRFEFFTDAEDGQTLWFGSSATGVYQSTVVQAGVATVSASLPSGSQSLAVRIADRAGNEQLSACDVFVR